MKKVRLHHRNKSTDSPLWQDKQYLVEIDGEFIDIPGFLNVSFLISYRVYVESDGIWVTKSDCGQGFGKRDYGERKLLISSREYSKIEYVGKPKEFTETMLYSMELMDIKQ